MVAPFLPIRRPLRQKPQVGAQINPNHDLAQGLIGCWLMNEGGGKFAYDISVYNNTISIFAGTVSTSSALFSSGFSFPGSGLLNKNGMSQKPTAQMTFVAWINTSNLAAINTISGMYTGSNGQEWGFEISAAGNLLVKWGAGNLILTGSKTLSINTWYQVAFTRSGTSGSWTATTYVNGLQDATASTATNPSTGQTAMQIGGNVGGNNHFIGTIDNCLCYNRPLSAAEIQQLYTDPFCFIQQPKIGIIKRKRITARTYGFAAAGGVQGTGQVGCAG